MKRRNPGRPDRARESGVTALWPHLGDEEPHEYELDKMYGHLVTNTQYNFEMGEWEPTPPSTRRPLLRIVCSDPHDGTGAPRLAEVWHTDRGLFYAAPLPGAFSDPPDHPTEPFAPPTAVLPEDLKADRRRLFDRARIEEHWQPIPVTVVRMFLEAPQTSEATLWVKCHDHGPGVVDRVPLYKAYVEDRERRRSHDTPDPTVIGLHDVRALSSR